MRNQLGSSTSTVCGFGHLADGNKFLDIAIKDGIGLRLLTNLDNFKSLQVIYI